MTMSFGVLVSMENNAGSGEITRRFVRDSSGNIVYLPTENKTKTLFSWMVSSDTRRPNPTVDNVTKKVFAAIENGKQVEVESSYGLPPPGTRGMIYMSCGCGVPFRRGVGYLVTDAGGKFHRIDAIALHHVACHRSKLDEEELSFLASLPECSIPCDEQVLKTKLQTSF